jgi:hypothetical protein
MNDKNIFDTLQNAQNEKFISEMGVFNEIIDNGANTNIPYDTSKGRELYDKQEEKEAKEKQLREQRKEELKYDPKLLQAGYDRLQRELSENERKLKQDYENAQKHLKTAQHETDKLKTALTTKQYQKADEHYKKASSELAEGIKIFNEEDVNAISNNLD